MRGALGFALTAAVMAGGLVGGRMMMPPTLAAAEPPAVVSASFDAVMAQSMTRMHADMMVPPSGDPDRDFAAMMIPHHEGAIAMAQAELLYGKDPVLRRLAQGIIVEQGQEIAVMRRALADL
ncbi:CopM family metallochaperone, partial [Methylobacterium goesingense]